MTAEKVLEKELQVTSNLSGITKGAFAIKARGYVTAMVANPTIAPDIEPAATVLDAEVALLEALHITKGELTKALKENTALVTAKERDIRTILNVHWVPQVQIAIAGDAAKAKKLGFGVKGVDNGTSEKVIGKASESHPLIIRIDTNVSLQQTVHVINNMTKKIKIPKDAEGINIYQQIGGIAPPNDIKNMDFIGIVKNGKFINHFEVADIGKIVYYIVVYTDKKTGVTLEMSPVSISVIS